MARALACLAALGVTTACAAAFVLDPGLATADPRDTSSIPTVRHGRPLDASLLLVIILGATGAVTLASLWRGSSSPARPIVLTASGLLVLLVTAGAGWLTNAAYFFFPDYTCRYDGCWPLPWQTWAACAPAILLGTSLLVVGVLPVARRTAFVVPALVWCVAAIVQRLTWNSLALPTFVGPPP